MIFSHRASTSLAPRTFHVPPAAARRTFGRKAGALKVAALAALLVSATQAQYTCGDYSWSVDRISQCDLELDNTATVSGVDASGVRVYVVESGITEHYVFHGNEVDLDTECHWSGLRESNDLVDGYGTYAASTACGVLGAASTCTICMVQVVEGKNDAPESDMLEQAFTHILNNCGSSSCVALIPFTTSEDLNDSIGQLTDAGIVVVVPAGDDNSVVDETMLPASLTNVITVGAISDDDTRDAYSNYGSRVNVYAPGTEIETASHRLSNECITQGGTRAASAHVAGIAAGILKKDPGLTPQQVADEIFFGAKLIGTDPEGNWMRLATNRGNCGVADCDTHVEACLNRCKSRFGGTTDWDNAFTHYPNLYICAKGCARVGGYRVVDPRYFCDAHTNGQNAKVFCYDHCTRATSAVWKCQYGCDYWDVFEP